MPTVYEYKSILTEPNKLAPNILALEDETVIVSFDTQENPLDTICKQLGLDSSEEGQKQVVEGIEGQFTLHCHSYKTQNSPKSNLFIITFSSSTQPSPEAMIAAMLNKVAEMNSLILNTIKYYDQNPERLELVAKTPVPGSWVEPYTITKVSEYGLDIDTFKPTIRQRLSDDNESHTTDLTQIPKQSPTSLTYPITMMILGAAVAAGGVAVMAIGIGTACSFLGLGALVIGTLMIAYHLLTLDIACDAPDEQPLSRENNASTNAFS